MTAKPQAKKGLPATALSRLPETVDFVSTPCDGSALAAKKAAAALSAVAALSAPSRHAVHRVRCVHRKCLDQETCGFGYICTRGESVVTRSCRARLALAHGARVSEGGVSAVPRSADKDRARARRGA